MLDMASAVCPAACDSFRRHLMGGTNFSSTEMAALRKVVAGEASGLSGKDEERFKAKLETGKQL